MNVLNVSYAFKIPLHLGFNNLIKGHNAYYIERVSYGNGQAIALWTVLIKDVEMRGRHEARISIKFPGPTYPTYPYLDQNKEASVPATNMISLKDIENEDNKYLKDLPIVNNPTNQPTQSAGARIHKKYRKSMRRRATTKSRRRVRSYKAR